MQKLERSQKCLPNTTNKNDKIGWQNQESINNTSCRHLPSHPAIHFPPSFPIFQPVSLNFYQSWSAHQTKIIIVLPCGQVRLSANWSRIGLCAGVSTYRRQSACPMLASLTERGGRFTKGDCLLAGGLGKAQCAERRNEWTKIVILRILYYMICYPKPD